MGPSSAVGLPNLPEEAIAWFRARFEEANRSGTENLVNNPNARETTLDDALLAPLQKRQPQWPYRMTQGGYICDGVKGTEVQGAEALGSEASAVKPCPAETLTQFGFVPGS